MEGAANHGDSSQRHAYDLHEVGDAIRDLAYDHADHAVLGLGFAPSTNDINDGFNPFNTITAGYYNDGLSLGTNNVDASIYPYNNIAALNFTNGAVQKATNANVNFNGGIHGPSSHGPNGTDYYGPTLGNVTAPGIAYDQGLSAALPLQYSNGGYPTGYTNANCYPPNNGAAIGSSHGSSGYVTNATALGAQFTGSTPTTSSALSPSTPGSVAEPTGRPRWACTQCPKTFSRQADMVRHAKKHTGELAYQCLVANCEYKGSYRLDKLEQHVRNCH